MNLLGNLIWLIFGGLAAALGYFFGGLILCVTIIGIPWGLQCFKLAGLVLWPFGKEVVIRKLLQFFPKWNQLSSFLRSSVILSMSQIEIYQTEDK